MAEMDTSSSEGKKGPGVKKAKKLSTRVDMTPMVDLGFLLITFFIFTASMSEPKALKLNMPKKTDDQTKEMEVSKSGMLTVLLGKDGTVFYYEGELKPDGSNFSRSSIKEIRQVIINKKQDVMSRYVRDQACI